VVELTLNPPPSRIRWTFQLSPRPARLYQSCGSWSEKIECT